MHEEGTPMANTAPLAERFETTRVPKPVLSIVERSPDPEKAAFLLTSRLQASAEWRFEPIFQIEAYEEALEDFPRDLLSEEEIDEIHETLADFVSERDRAVLRVKGIPLDLITIWRWVRDELETEIDLGLVAEGSGDPDQLLHAQPTVTQFRSAGTGRPSLSDKLPPGIELTSDPAEAVRRTDRVLHPDERGKTVDELPLLINRLADELTDSPEDGDPDESRAKELTTEHMVSVLLRVTRQFGGKSLLSSRKEKWRELAEQESEDLWFWDSLLETLQHPRPPPARES